MLELVAFFVIGVGLFVFVRAMIPITKVLAKMAMFVALFVVGLAAFAALVIYALNPTEDIETAIQDFKQGYHGADSQSTPNPLIRVPEGHSRIETSESSPGPQDVPAESTSPNSETLTPDKVEPISPRSAAAD